MEANINSANIEKLTWQHQTLRIHFTSGQVVAYKEVPEGIAVGMAQAASCGSYMRLYITGKYTYEVEREPGMVIQNKSLQHYADSTSGLWCTDRPDLIPEEYRGLLFMISYSEMPPVVNSPTT